MPLTSPERDNSSGWVVGRYPYRDPVPGDDLDAKTPHLTAELSQYLVTGVALNSIKPATVDSHHGPLNINEIVFRQRTSRSQKYTSLPASFVPSEVGGQRDLTASSTCLAKSR